MRRSKNRESTSVNAVSMADIAFLLLIFFLVTTIILNEKGILVKLPRWEETPPKPTAINERNVLSIKIREDNQVMAEGNPIELTQIRTFTKNFIQNPQQLETYPSRPTKAIISLQHDRGTAYEKYLIVYDELKAAYRELWETAAQAQYNRPLNQLPYQTQQKIRNQFPMVISEAEPFAYHVE